MESGDSEDKAPLPLQFHVGPSPGLPPCVLGLLPFGPSSSVSDTRVYTVVPSTDPAPPGPPWMAV